MGSAEIQGDLWGTAARDWAELAEPHHRPLFEVMLDEANVASVTRILDAGCGGGGASVLAAQRGAKVSGLDASAAMIEVAKERVPAGDFRVGDIQALPFDDHAFDAVIAPNSLQYSDDRIATLQELGRVCTRDGRVVVGLFSAPDKVQYSVVMAAVRNILPEPPPGKGPFELSESGVLEDLIQQAGLNVKGSGEVECPFDYPDYETLRRANASAGPFQAAMKSVGAEELSRAVRDAIQPYQESDGSIHMENWYIYVTATP